MEDSNIDLTELIEKCQTTLSAIKKTNHSQHLALFFKNLIEDMSQCVDALQNQKSNFDGHRRRNLIMLCICQTSKCLPLLLEEIERIVVGNVVESQEAKRYLIDRMHWCLDGLLTEIQSGNTDERYETSGSKFVLTMDAALEAVHGLANTSEFETEELVEALKQLKLVVEELLCHAMTIVQISETSDFQAITYSSQKILNILEQFKQECLSASTSPAVCQMFANSLAETLESLEQQVNTAVLRLVLQVFCEPYGPLQRLMEACISEKPEIERQSADLDLLIVDFDLFMDRVMQIGLFAMACTGDDKRMLSTRSCLASLESLEPELVPTLTAHYLEPANKSHRNYLRLLTSHWKTEIGRLHDLIDGIVDPAAFCQVTVDEASQIVAHALQELNENQLEDLKVNVKKAIRQSKKLVRHLKVGLSDSSVLSADASELQFMMKELSRACHECDACANLIFAEKSADKTQWNRVLKRCQLVITTMKKIQPMLMIVTNTTQPQNVKVIPENKNCKTSTTGGGILFPESVSDLTIDETLTSLPGSIKYEWLKNPLNPLMKSGLYGRQKDLTCLTPYLDAGKVLSQERSILYATPKRGQPIRTPLAVSKLVASAPRTQRRLFTHNNSFDCTFANNKIASQTLGLDITDILDKLTMLSDTLTSLPNETETEVESVDPLPHKLSCLMEEESLDESMEEYHSLPASPRVSDSSSQSKETILRQEREEAETDLSQDVTASLSSDSKYQIDTYNRLEDLNNIEARLRGLRDSHK